jgi:hypothetical protein
MRRREFMALIGGAVAAPQSLLATADEVIE